MLQVKLVKSPIGNTARNRATVKALGLRKMHQTIYLPDNESVRGMIHRVKHMLSVEVVDDSAAPAKVKSKPKRALTGKPEKTAPAPAPKKAEAKAAPTPKAEAKAVEPKAEAKTEAKPKAAAKPKSDGEAKPKAAAKPKSESAAKAAKPKTTKSKEA